MKAIQLYFVLLAFLALNACGSKGTQSESTTSEQTIAVTEEEGTSDNAVKSIVLDDTKMKNYIGTIKKLKEKGAEFSQDINQLNSIFKYKELEGIVQEGGFKDFNEFINVHTKIVYAVVINEMEAQDVDSKIKEAQKESTKELEKSLNDPNISEEQKKIIQQTIEQMKGMENLGSQMESATSMYRSMVTDADIAVAKKYSEELKKMYEDNR
jgi:hypothetical protein